MHFRYPACPASGILLGLSRGVEAYGFSLKAHCHIRPPQHSRDEHHYHTRTEMKLEPRAALWLFGHGGIIPRRCGSAGPIIAGIKFPAGSAPAPLLMRSERRVGNIRHKSTEGAGARHQSIQLILSAASSQHMFNLYFNVNRHKWFF